MDTGRLRDWLALSLTPGLGPAGCRLLADRFGGPGAVFAASAEALRGVAGLKKGAVAALLEGPRLAAADEELHKADKAGVRIVAWDDAAFPPLLRAIHNPPLLLYVKGRDDLLRRPGLGVVGARAATDYGQKVAGALAGRLAKRGLVITSGMALGIDSAAHGGALAVGGHTMAVLGCGVDVVYPEYNRKLYARIAEQGALVSEYPLGTEPETFRFPARNRIISGMSLGILVVEAARRSGSLITAHLALEQGREVFAVPGRVDSCKSEGVHRLVQQGAKLVHSVDDIMEELPQWYGGAGDFSGMADTTGSGPALTSDEQVLVAFLDNYPKNIEEIIQRSGFSAPKAAELLILLELKGVVVSLPGQQYRRCG